MNLIPTCKGGSPFSKTIHTQIYFSSEKYMAMGVLGYSIKDHQVLKYQPSEPFTIYIGTSSHISPDKNDVEGRYSK